ncbi:hypothetical protein BF29_2889 [Heyndrickxia coagulans DSM 1 = ATCC 7050]|nr:hypothetical protein BF29_2889 [Heyndrickxia coagulans DSM 1 = ATCC 7050]
MDIISRIAGFGKDTKSLIEFEEHSDPGDSGMGKMRNLPKMDLWQIFSRGVNFSPTKRVLGREPRQVCQSLLHDDLWVCSFII